MGPQCQCRICDMAWKCRAFSCLVARTYHHHHQRKDQQCGIDGGTHGVVDWQSARRREDHPSRSLFSVCVCVCVCVCVVSSHVVDQQPSRLLFRTLRSKPNQPQSRSASSVCRLRADGKPLYIDVSMTRTLVNRSSPTELPLCPAMSLATHGRIEQI